MGNGMNCSQVNPAFISAFNNLRSARNDMNAAKRLRLANKGNKDIEARYFAAEAKFHAAEEPFCNQVGIIAGGNMSKNQAEAQVDGIMNTVHSWYA